MLGWAVAAGALLVKSSAAAEWSLLDGANTNPEYIGSVPKKSDVILSSRYKRPDTIDAIRSFGVNRVEWVYSTDAAFVTEVRKAAGWFGGTINSIPTDVADVGRAKDFDGSTVAPEKLRPWNGRWITTTAPETERFLRDQVRKYIELGVDSIQVDDPSIQLYSAQMWGGDFNESTLQGFPSILQRYSERNESARALLADMTGSYRDWIRKKYGVKDAQDYLTRSASFPETELWLRYIRDTVAEHFVGLRSYLTTLKKGSIPLSMNLAYLDEPDEKNKHFFLAAYADYAVAETPIKSTEQMIVRSSTLRALGIGFVPSILPRQPSRNRSAIATLYALGAQPLVPWDVFTGMDSKGQAVRFFGTPEAYGDLYSFVRNNPTLFDGREQTSVVGVMVPVDKYDHIKTNALVKKLASRQIPFAYVLVGGERNFKVDPSKLKNFKAVILPNAEEDYASRDIELWRASATIRLTGAQIDGQVLEDLAPFVLSKDERLLHLYPRAKPLIPTNLVIHVVDEAVGESVPAGVECNHKISIMKSFLGSQTIRRVRWFSGAGSQSAVKVETVKATQISWQSCSVWGALELELTH